MMSTGRSHTLVIRVEGVLDVPAAQGIVERLERADGEVHVDLTHVREFHDSGVVMLARALGQRAMTTVTGLRHHHVRLLRYLGIDTGAAHQTSAAELA